MTDGSGGPAVRRGDLVAGGLFVALGVALCMRAVGLTVGSAHDPQPGFFPLIGGILLIVLAGLVIAQAFRGTEETATAERESLGPPVILVSGLAVYAALLEWAGYPLMTTLMALLALRVLGTRWVPGVAAAVLLALGSYFLFLKLGVPLPPGQLFGG